MNRSPSFAQRSAGGSRESCLDLGNDRKRDLARPFGSEMKAERRVQSLEVAVAAIDALGLELREHPTRSLTRTEDADVDGTRSKERCQRRAVALVVMRHD